MLKDLLSHPKTKGLDIDDPRTTALRRDIIREKPFLRQLYEEWYASIIRLIPLQEQCPGEVLEIGSGGGFLHEVFPECIASEIFLTPGVDIVLDGQALPFADKTLRAILMVDVLHHIPNAEAFFLEAQRVLSVGGRILMVEPWNTLWGRFVYSNLHHEPFLPSRSSWDLPKDESTPLSNANGALPWMIFSRDINAFHNKFPRLTLRSIRLDYPFSYLASGGVSMRSLTPGWSFKTWRKFETLLNPFMKHLAMFALISVEVKDEAIKK